MKICHASKIIELDEKDLFKGFECPVCGGTYLPNGTGPQNLGFVAKLLKWFPSESMVGGIPARFHDAAYLLASAGWVVVYDSGLAMYHAWNKRSADLAYLGLMRERSIDAKGPARWLSRSAAARNYCFVRLFGKKSFGHVRH